MLATKHLILIFRHLWSDINNNKNNLSNSKKSKLWIISYAFNKCKVTDWHVHSVLAHVIFACLQNELIQAKKIFNFWKLILGSANKNVLFRNDSLLSGRLRLWVCLWSWELFRMPHLSPVYQRSLPGKIICIIKKYVFSLTTSL